MAINSIPAVAEDRAAIGRVEDAIQKWGKMSVVYRQQDADIVLAVESLHQRTCWLSMPHTAAIAELSVARNGARGIAEERDAAVFAV